MSCPSITTPDGLYHTLNKQNLLKDSSYYNPKNQFNFIYRTIYHPQEPPRKIFDYQIAVMDDDSNFYNSICRKNKLPLVALPTNMLLVNTNNVTKKSRIVTNHQTMLLIDCHNGFIEYVEPYGAQYDVTLIITFLKQFFHSFVDKLVYETTILQKPGGMFSDKCAYIVTQYALMRKHVINQQVARGIKITNKDEYMRMLTAIKNKFRFSMYGQPPAIHGPLHSMARGPPPLGKPEHRMYGGNKYKYKYIKYKQKYLNIKYNKRGGYYDAAVGGEHILEISGPIEMFIFKSGTRNPRNIYLFGEKHGGWENLCYDDETICKNDQYCFSIIQFFHELIRRNEIKNDRLETPEYIDFYIESTYIEKTKEPLLPELNDYTKKFYESLELDDLDPITHKIKKMWGHSDQSKKGPLDRLKQIFSETCQSEGIECPPHIRFHRIDYRGNIGLDPIFDISYEIYRVLSMYKELVINHPDKVELIAKFKEYIKELIYSEHMDKPGNMYRLAAMIKRLYHMDELPVVEDIPKYSINDLNRILELMLQDNIRKIMKQYLYSEFPEVTIRDVFDILKRYNMERIKQYFRFLVEIVFWGKNIESYIKTHIDNLADLDDMYDIYTESFEHIFNASATIGAIFMDLYTIGRIFRKFKEPTDIPLPAPKNIVTLTGSSHTNNYNIILQEIFKKFPIFSQYTSHDEIQCMKIPYTKINPEDVLNFDLRRYEGQNINEIYDIIIDTVREQILSEKEQLDIINQGNFDEYYASVAEYEERKADITRTESESDNMRATISQLHETYRGLLDEIDKNFMLKRKPIQENIKKLYERAYDQANQYEHVPKFKEHNEHIKRKINELLQ